MLGDFRRALLEAASDSAEVHRTWRQLKDEGYALFLVVDLEKEKVSPQGLLTAGEPQFLLSGEDVALLRSLGIDPTRRRRRRRRKPKGTGGDAKQPDRDGEVDDPPAGGA